MLKTRVVTAVILLAVLLLVVWSRSSELFLLTAAAFFAAASWEMLRLFGSKRPLIGAALWTGLFIFLMFNARFVNQKVFFGICVALWLIRFVPSLKLGLPAMDGFANRLLGLVVGIAILGCFLSIAVLYSWSPLYLLSVMALVWIADIGAYFSGKAFGKHKLAPSISPGKTWEGAIGGGVAVLLLSSVSVVIPVFADTFAVHVQGRWGWGGLIAVMVLFVAASIVGDLFESQLKRRANMKDSSNLLPGHGGVLDRIDALLPTLPLAVLIGYWL
ncbi:phosphatidate cytidylyltransferase [Actimicrobium antarcticum]|uniref:Phosphatidate cytidylyltransferase n=1 Tax=Actimicrobium antarcticum TaxID=1051899 RepID=A0ABP7TR72_9BURK